MVEMQLEIIFLRHGEAESGNFVKSDLVRKLTKRGRNNVPYLGEFDLVLSSLAKRASETAVIAAGREPDAKIISLSTHCWNGDRKRVDAVFVALGNVALRDAYSQASCEQRRACADISKAAAKEVLLKISKKSSQRILICGHALFLQALAQKIISEGEGDWVADIVLGEGKYFTVIVNWKF